MADQQNPVPSYPSGVPQYAQQMTVAGQPMTYETLMELLAGAGPGAKEKLSRLAVVDDYAKYFEQMQKRAEEEDALNQINEPKGLEVGGTYVAPNFTQYLAKALRGYESMKAGKAGKEGILGNIGAKQGGLEEIMQLMEKQQQGLEAARLAAILRGNPSADSDIARALDRGIDPTEFGPGGDYQGYY